MPFEPKFSAGRRVATLLLALLSLSTPLRAAEEAEAVRQALGRLVPNMTPDLVRPSPLPGLYEVLFGTRVVYVSSDGRYLIQGQLMDVDSRRNLTEETQSIARREALKGLDESEMIVFGPTKARHTITVFTDIDCAFCRRMHAQIAEYNDLGIRVRYLAYPRAGADSESYRTAVSVWCAKDRNSAMTQAKRGEAVAPIDCEAAPIRHHLYLGQMFGITGTPGVFTESGELIGGYIEPKQMAAMLEQEKTAQVDR